MDERGFLDVADVEVCAARRTGDARAAPEASCWGGPPPRVRRADSRAEPLLALAAEHAAQRLEAVFANEVRRSPAHDASPRTKFNYAWALSRSVDNADVARCIPLFEGARPARARKAEAQRTRALTLAARHAGGARRGQPSDLFASGPEYVRECHYFLAEAHFRLGHYRDARRHNDALRALEPHNHQAEDLAHRIEHQLAQGAPPAPAGGRGGGRAGEGPVLALQPH